MIDFFNTIFNTDWSAFNSHTWLAVIITVGVFFLMIGIYFYVFRPKNRDRLESYRDMALKDENEEDKKDE